MGQFGGLTSIVANIQLGNKKDYRNPSYRRPDHPSFGEKRHSMIVDAQGASNREIKTESGTLKFENGVAVLPNDTRAKDVYDELLAKHARHPKQFMLSEKRGTVNVSDLHRFSFGWSRTFASAWERAFGKFENDSETEDKNEQGIEVDSAEHSSPELYPSA